MTTDLKSLLERVRAATGPDREIDRAVLDNAAGHLELHGDSIRCELVAESDCHVPVRVDARQFLKVDLRAVPATVSLPLHPKVGLLPLERMVSELHYPRAVFDHIGKVAGAFRHDRILGGDVDIELAVNLFQRGREQALDTQQVPAQHPATSHQWGAAA